MVWAAVLVTLVVCVLVTVLGGAVTVLVTVRVVGWVEVTVVVIGIVMVAVIVCV
jgi:hypothetical protein